MAKIVQGAALMFCLLFSHGSFASCDKATIFYLPLNIEEYTPGGFSNSNIKSTAAEKWMVTEPARIQQLLKILRKGHAHPYEDGRTRALIECGDNKFYLNKDGDVEINGSSIRIDLRKFLKFHDSLRPDERLSLD
jgi:hypothetical protein